MFFDVFLCSDDVLAMLDERNVLKVKHPKIKCLECLHGLDACLSMSMLKFKIGYDIP